MVTSSISVSVVIPVYGCRKILEMLVSKLKAVFDHLGLTYEIILVEDGCPAYSWEEILLLAEKHKQVKGLRFSRNFGQHEAITAGLVQAAGEWIVVMDCDLQDRPEEIVRLYEKAQEGFDLVFACRNERQDSFFRKQVSRIFYAVLSYVTGTELDASVANFGIYHHRVIKAVLAMKESYCYFPVMVRRVGFNGTAIDVQHDKRYSGKTSYSLKKLVSLSLEVMAFFSDRPLRLTVVKAVCLTVFISVLAVVFMCSVYFFKYGAEGWSGIMVLLGFTGGVIMAMAGFYVGKLFAEIKKRSHYTIDQTINCDE
jgi:dolichol-phosphate mannosyltransferase